MRQLRTAARIGLLGGLILMWAGAAFADPCLVVYPSSPCTYHYSPAEYYTVGFGDPLYNPQYDRGGLVLLSLGSNEIDLSIYQAPQLTGFVADSGDQGYYFSGDEFDLVIDGFNNSPTTYVNILVEFDKPEPAGCVPQIMVDGSPIAGTVYVAGDLVVNTPTLNGHNYSDVVIHHVAWSGCYGLHVWSFSDANYDGQREGRECFTAFSHDLAVPIETTTWGSVKAIYR